MTGIIRVKTRIGGFSSGVFALPAQPAAGGGGGFSPEATALFAAMTSSPDAAHKTLIDNLIVALKSAGIWTLLDWFWAALGNQHDSLLNWKNPAQTGTNVNSLTHTNYVGFSGADDVSKYMSTTYNLSTGGGNWARNAACVFAWSDQSSGGGGFAGSSAGVGAGGAVLLPRASSDDNSYWYVNGTPYNTNADGAVSPPGLWSANRSGASAEQLYLNGSALHTGAVASTAIVSGTMDFGTYARGSAIVVSATGTHFKGGGLGGSLDATKQAALYGALNTYLAAI